MSITAGWDYCLGTAGVCQDSCAGCYTFSPFSITVKFQVIEPCRFPYNLHGKTSDRGSYKVTHNAGNAGYPLWLLFSHWGELKVQGRCFHVMVHWPGGGATWSTCGHFFFFTLLMSFLLVSVVQGFASASLPCSRSLSVVSWYWIDVSCFSCIGGVKSRKTYVNILVASLRVIFSIYSSHVPFLPAFFPHLD